MSRRLRVLLTIQPVAYVDDGDELVPLLPPDQKLSPVDVWLPRLGDFAERFPAEVMEKLAPLLADDSETPPEVEPSA